MYYHIYIYNICNVHKDDKATATEPDNQSSIQPGTKSSSLK